MSSERAQWVIRFSMLFTKGFKLHLIKLTTYDLFKLKSSRFTSFSLKMSHLFKIHSLFSKNKTYVYRDESSLKYRGFLRSFDVSRTNPSINPKIILVDTLFLFLILACPWLSRSVLQKCLLTLSYGKLPTSLLEAKFWNTSILAWPNFICQIVESSIMEANQMCWLE